MKSLVLKIAAALSVLLTAVAGAQIQAVPPNVSPDPNLPMVMLNVSKDFSMFSRAYTDYEDLNFDGVIDYTFMPYFKYYGYFDPTKCYSYSSNTFVPDSLATTETVTGDPSGSTRYYCSGLWSGNFLNWATMSRIDVLRKILFGGLRSTDTTSKTVLELAFVPRNSQAYAKFYNGSDLNRLTPFNYAEGLTLCRRHENPGTDNTQSQSSTLRPVIRAARGNYILWNMTEVRSCNWSGEIAYAWKTPTVNFMTANYVGAGGASTHNTSIPSSGNEYVARIEACKTGLVGEERCKQYPNSGTPILKPIGLLHEFGESDNYGNKAARSEFALMMGSFDVNLDGAVLRKNMAEINDEIDSDTGVFKVDSDANKRGIIYTLSKLRLYGYQPEGGSYSQNCNSTNIANGNCPSWGNPISEILLEGLRFYSGKSALYTSGTKDAEFGLPAPAWIDPLTATRTYSGSTKTRATLYGKNVCRPLNMVTISSGVGTFDENAMGALNDATTGIGAPQSAAYYTNLIGDANHEKIAGTTRLIGTNGTVSDGLCTGKTIAGLGDASGLCPDAPNMRGTYLGAGAALYAHTNKIRNLTVPAGANADVLKVRQYAVTMSGGSASIRIPVPGTTPQKFVYITPASRDWNGVAGLAGNMVDFKVLKRSSDGSSGTFIVLWQHQTLGEDQDQDMLGSIRYETDTSTSPPSLRIYTQTLESDTGSSVPFAFGYTLVGTQRDGSHFHSGINNYTSLESPAPTYAASSIQPSPRNRTDRCYLNDDGTTTGNFFNASTGQNEGWSYPKAPRLCTKIGNDFVKGETMLSYQMLGSTDAVIQDPLWYIAKYGGFKDDPKNPTGFPDAASKWDVKRADGAACGATGQPSCSDGIPDNYYLARRPDLLEESLRQVFADITANSNSAPAVSRPDLRTGDFKYVANFSASDLHGELLAYKLDSAGNFGATPTASGQIKLTDTLPANRQIMTNLGTTGVAFTYAALNVTAGASYLSDLGTNATIRQDRINYLRGVRSKEKLSGGSFRDRPADSIMGGVVNSNPWLQDVPSANFFGTAFSGYGTFKGAQKDRTKLVWVGAGDGMLHAFTAESLAPVMSYVPQVLSPRLPEVMDASISEVRAYMDGSPFTGDVKTSDSTNPWRTYLFASLGRGGKGIFALDVTSTSTLTEANAASIFRWQFKDDADLGHIISDGGIHPITGQAAQIAKMPNGKFAVIFGNGVPSTATTSTARAALYILFVDGPDSAGTWTNNTHFKKIVVGSANGNGLMQPTWLDTNDDGLADTIYAGDLKGNMWKFDVSSSDPALWQEAYGKPLYSATDSSDAAVVGNPLPITTAPAMRFHPNGGQVVVFGTGRSIVSGDFPDSSRSYRVYGIWDKPSYATATGTIPTGISELQARAWTVNSAGAIVQGSTTAINWATQKGWYVDIPLTSGMVLGNPRVVGKDINIPIVYKTATTGEVCNDSAQGADVQINAVTGISPVNIFGQTSSTGVVIGLSGLDQRFTIAEDSTARCTAGLSCNRLVGPNTDVTTKQNTTQSRIFWREIPGLKTTTESH